MIRLRWGRSRRGQSLVEMALVLPVFLLILIGLFDFGRAIYASNAIGNAARTANRVAIVDQNETRIREAAVQEAVGVGLAPGDVTIAYSCTHQIVICNATVSVSIEYLAATPLIHTIVGPLTLSASSEMPIERLHVSP